jgi:hypothetical protein
MCGRSTAPHTPEELQALRDSGRVVARTVTLHDTDDRRRLQPLCLLALTEQDTYAVVILPRDALRSLRLPHREPVESDYRMRRVAVEIADARQTESVQNLLGDLWSVRSVPGYAEGRAMDYEIRWLRERHFRVIVRSEETEQRGKGKE